MNQILRKNKILCYFYLSQAHLLQAKMKKTTKRNKRRNNEILDKIFHTNYDSQITHRHHDSGLYKIQSKQRKKRNENDSINTNEVKLTGKLNKLTPLKGSKLDSYTLKLNK